MKKFLSLLVCLSVLLLSRAQTTQELTNVINTKPISITTTGVSANSTNLFSVDLTTTGFRSIQVTITGTWVGTVSFQASSDNFTTTDNITVYQTTTGTWSTTTTANGTFDINTRGYRYIRVRTTAYTSGTINSTAYGILSNSLSPTFMADAMLLSGTPTGTQLGLITNSINYGKSTAGGGAYVEVKVTPSGAQQTALGDISAVTGQATMANSIPVTLASNQSSIPVTMTSTTVTGSVAVTGTFWQATQPVSGTFWQATQPVSGTVAATQSGTWNIGSLTTFPDNEPFNVAQINGVTPLMGNGATGTGSIRVTIASDNTAFTVNAAQSGTWNITNVSGTVSLPTGASTSANQTTEITALQLIDNLPNTIGSTTSGQSGALAFGAVTTSAPTYTTAQSNPLSLQTDGALRVAVTSTNNSANIAQINGVTPLMGNGVTGTGSMRVTLASDMTAISTTGYMSVKFDQTTPGSTNGVSEVASATGGASIFHLVSAATTNATNIKASAGKVYGYYFYNANAAARKITFHNTSGTPTAGASVYFSCVIPPGSGANMLGAPGIDFSSGIAITLVTGTADSDATAVAAGDLIINVIYK